MRSVAAVLAFSLVGLLLWPCLEMAQAEAPAPLPDLSVSPDDITLSYFGMATDYILPGYPTNIDVTVHNIGPGNSTSANVTFFIDGIFAAVIHVMGNLSVTYSGNETSVSCIWDTTSVSAGNHTVRVVVNDTAGDADPTDNEAERAFPVISAPPALSLRLDPPSREAVVSPTLNGTVRFSGSARVFLAQEQEALVNLSSSVDTGWASSVTPDVFNITDNLEHPFEVEVVVPGATHSDVIASVRIQGKCRAGGFVTNTQSSVIITIRAYFGVTADAVAARKEIAPGGTATFPVEVRNTGNSVDSYEVVVSNQQELKQAGWDILLTQYSIPKLPPGENRTIAVTVISRQDWTPYQSASAAVRLNISSDHPKDISSTISTTVVLSVKSAGFNAPCVSALTLVIVVCVVAAAAFILSRKRRNRGKTAKDYLKELDIDDGD